MNAVPSTAKPHVRRMRDAGVGPCQEQFPEPEVYSDMFALATPLLVSVQAGNGHLNKRSAGRVEALWATVRGTDMPLDVSLEWQWSQG